MKKTKNSLALATMLGCVSLSIQGAYAVPNQGKVDECLDEIASELNQDAGNENQSPACMSNLDQDEKALLASQLKEKYLPALNSIIPPRLRSRLKILVNEKMRSASQAIYTSDSKYVLVSGSFYDVETGKMKATLEYGKEFNSVRDIQITADDKYVIGNDFHNVIVWDVQTGKKLYSKSFQGGDSDYVLSPKGNRFATYDKGAWPHGVAIWDTQTGSLIRKLTAPYVTHFYKDKQSFSPDGKLFFAMRKDLENKNGTLGSAVWDLETGKELLTFHEHSGTFHPELGLLVIASSDELKIYSKDLELVKKIPITIFGPDHLEFSPDGSRILLRWLLEQVEIISITEGRSLYVRRNEADKLTFDRQLSKVFERKFKGTSLTDLAGNSIMDIAAPYVVVSSFDPSGRYLLIDESERMNIWDIESRSFLTQLSVKGDLLHLGFSVAPNGKTVVSSGMVRKDEYLNLDIWEMNSINWDKFGPEAMVETMKIDQEYLKTGILDQARVAQLDHQLSSKLLKAYPLKRPEYNIELIPNSYVYETNDVEKVDHTVSSFKRFSAFIGINDRFLICKKTLTGPFQGNLEAYWANSKSSTDEYVHPAEARRAYFQLEKKSASVKRTEKKFEL